MPNDKLPNPLPAESVVFTEKDIMRFWRVVDKNGPNGCWVWMGRCNPDGYGLYYAQHKTFRAHRVSWMIAVGDIPDGMFMDHKCRNRRCVRPEHLRVATPGQNALENSLSLQAQNAAKTHCLNGHPLSGDNLVDHGRGYRNCLTCKRIKNRIAMRVIRANRRLGAVIARLDKAGI